MRESPLSVWTAPGTHPGRIVLGYISALTGNKYIIKPMTQDDALNLASSIILHAAVVRAMDEDEV